MRNIEIEYKKIATNFMTPIIIKYNIDRNRIVELSKGEDFNGNIIYGVSEFIYEDSRLSTTKRGQMHRSRKSADKHYKVLLNK